VRGWRPARRFVPEGGQYEPALCLKEEQVAAVRSLHGTTPAEMFESGLERLEEIDAIAMCVLWNDGTVTAGWSNVDGASLAYMIAVLNERFRSLHLGEAEP